MSIWLWIVFSLTCGTITAVMAEVLTQPRRTDHYSTNAPAKRKGKDFVFLVHTKNSKPTRTVGGVQRALINSHIAKHSHDKRRAETLAASVACVPSGMSNRPDHFQSARTYVHQLMNLMERDTNGQRNQKSFNDILFGSLLASVLRYGNSDPFTTTNYPCHRDGPRMPRVHTRLLPTFPPR